MHGTAPFKPKGTATASEPQFFLLRVGRALRLQRIGSLNEGMSFNPFSWADLLDRDGVQIVVDTTFILVAIGLAAARYLL
ncbi:hypothetical protein BHAOGJBA_1362 [Methylobacterium hispanicum]|uniref:Uncharacterized protein n=1 Tax=Methylobacterium hispanicum TaxID=270350 RepID=A0AAV4ZI46_9HYPH|nr:hypothetical protein BHAOGJBA_1362 [Methylobacterium hispanicum]